MMIETNGNKKLLSSSGSWNKSDMSGSSNNATNEHSQPDGSGKIASPASSNSLSEKFSNSESLLSLFSTLYDKEQYSVAYAAGIKFVELALLQIPKNGHFKSRKYLKQRTRSATDALRVTKLLGGMLDEMEEDENGGIQKIERLHELATLAQQSFDEAVNVDDDGGESNTDGGTTSHSKEWDVAQRVSQLWKYHILAPNSGSVIDNVLNLPDSCCATYEENQQENEAGQESNTTYKPDLLQQRQDSDHSIMTDRQLSLQSDIDRQGLNELQQEELMNDSAEQQIEQTQEEASEAISLTGLTSSIGRISNTIVTGHELFKLRDFDPEEDDEKKAHELLEKKSTVSEQPPNLHLHNLPMVNRICVSVGVGAGGRIFLNLASASDDEDELELKEYEKMGGKNEGLSKLMMMKDFDRDDEDDEEYVKEVLDTAIATLEPETTRSKLSIFRTALSLLRLLRSGIRKIKFWITTRIQTTLSSQTLIYR
ncbi:hypothetical protein QTG54_014740 [Skeletonema marinoi]|uniref:Uncharacterized protein n=1 Tax=Skeletonema marinoi TaxID=267567 RepID=A0AAD8XVJ5_9STRA|nr:hypothetical protein QTG54_014740 [Skeletonema marinoi]